MRKGYHQIPILDFEGKNLEEKETRHDFDTKLVEEKGVKNNHSSRNNITSD